VYINYLNEKEQIVAKFKMVVAGWCCAMVLFMAGCAVKTTETDTVVSKPDQLSYDEQKEKAYDIFKQILDLSNAENRQENLPEIKRLYREIIEKYPEVPLAQECYLRLIIIAKDEKSNAGDEEAQRLYQEFQKVYPDSKLKKIIENKMKQSG